MRRSPAFDPPEYVRWRRDEALVRGYADVVGRDAERGAVVAGLSRAALLALYAGLVRARLADTALARLVRRGALGKAWLGTGEEACTVGPVHALRRPADGPAPDVVAPVIRNAAACYEMGMPVADVLRAYLGTADSPSAGRDGHCGRLDAGVLPPVSHLGDMVPVTAGVALSFQLRAARAGVRGPSRVAMTWIGDGTLKTGAAHEGLNLAAVRRLPAIFIVQNNQVALGTRVEQSHLGGDLARLPEAYGMQGAEFDGNNVLDAYAATRLAAERCRRGEGPVMLVATTFRMGGHATHDEAEARRLLDPALRARWGARDPVALYEEHLVERGVGRPALAAVERAVAAEVDAAERAALASREGRMPAGPEAVAGVYGAAPGGPPPLAGARAAR